MATTRDPYETLGLSRTASQDEIQRAYRRLAREYHPDLNKDPGAEDRFKQISEAYHVLSDPDARRRYDQSRTRAGAGPAPGGAGWRSVDDFDLADLFGDLFAGAGRPGRGWGRVRGVDQEAELTVPVEEAYEGGRRAVTLTEPGGGTRTLSVTIPPGVTDGQRLRLSGQGAPGDGAPAGDLYLTVRIAPHLRYRVAGRDLIVDLPLAPWEAALGASVAVDTPGGEVKVKVPAGTSSGQRLRLPGRGLPNPRGTPGNLYAETRIVVPAKLSRQERKLFQELATTSTFDPRRQR